MDFYGIIMLINIIIGFDKIITLMNLRIVNIKYKFNRR
jgi:hypothetical protein